MEKQEMRYKILVVEDTPETMQNIVADLNRHLKNVEVLESTNLSRGFMLYNQNLDIDLAIIDLEINSGDGPGPFKSDSDFKERDNGATINDAIGMELINEIRSKNTKIELIAYTNIETEAIIDQLNRVRAHHEIKRTFSHPPRKLITLVVQLLSKNPGT